ncbi:hypothetical protein Tco_1319172 [Tanacetum coccineum]
MWIGDDGFLEFVSNAWAFNFPYVTPDLMLKNKVKSLRLAIKTCTSDQIMAQKQYANFNIKGLHFDEIWCESPDLIKQAVAGHFSSRFKEGNKCRPTFSSSLFQRLSVVDANFLEADLSMDEIKSAVWDWGGSKALGSDDFEFKIGIPNIEVQEVASLLGCIHDPLPFAYPGLLVGKKMRFCDRWNEVINHFRERLSTLKDKALLIGGRLTLVKSILGSLPIYYLSLFKAPKKVINLLKSIRCRFFWGFKESQRESWSSWKMEMGIRYIARKPLGEYLLRDLWDSVAYESLVGLPRPNGIWCDILKAVKDMEIINPSFKRSFHIKVLDGANVSFWKDPGVRMGLDRVDDIKQEDIFPSIQRISKIWISARASSRPANWNRWIARPFDLFGAM